MSYAKQVPEENIEEFCKIETLLNIFRLEIIPILEKRVDGVRLTIAELKKFETFNYLRGRSYDLID